MDSAGLQASATYPHPEPDQSTPWPPIPFLTIHRNIILTSTPGSSNWSLFPRFYHQKPVCTFPLPHTCYMPRPFQSSRFDYPNNISWEVRSLGFLLFSFHHSPVTSSLLGPNIILNTLFSSTLSLRSSLNVSDQVSHPYKTNTYPYSLIMPS